MVLPDSLLLSKMRIVCQTVGLIELSCLSVLVEEKSGEGCVCECGRVVQCKGAF